MLAPVGRAEYDGGSTATAVASMTTTPAPDPAWWGDGAYAGGAYAGGALLDGGDAYAGGGGAAAAAEGAGDGWYAGAACA